MSYSYKDLIAWQRAMELVVAVYRVTADFPKEERFGLVSQLRRAAVSVPSNIAEGQGRTTPGEFKLFLGQARGSLMEVETQMDIASRLEMLEAGQFESVTSLTNKVGRLLNGLLLSDLHQHSANVKRSDSRRRDTRY